MKVRLAIEWMDGEDGNPTGWRVRIPGADEKPEVTVPLTKWDLKFTTADGEVLRFQSPKGGPR